MEKRLNEPSITIKSWIEKWKSLRDDKAIINDDNDACYWLKDTMRIPPNSSLFDWSYFDKYKMNEGLEVFIEGFHNAPTKLPLITICSFNPPGNYYKTPKSIENVFFYSKVDFSSPQKSIRYEDELKILKGINPYDSWQLILDIKSVSMSNHIQLEDCGWSILPLFNKTDRGVYVNTGTFIVFT